VKFKTFYLPLVAMLLLVINTVQAQDNSGFFDEGKLPEKPNAIKLDVLSAIYGDVSLYLERALTNKISIEVGGGVLLSHYNPATTPLFFKNELEGEIDSGFTWSIFPRYYVAGGALDSYYIGAQYKHRNFDMDGRNITQESTTFNFGYQWYPETWIMFDIYAGLGFYAEDPPRSTVLENTTGVAAGVGARVSFNF